MKTIVKYIGQYKKDSILTPLFTALEVVMEVLLPFITAKIIDNGLQAGNMQAVYQYGIVMLVMAFFSLAFGALAGKYAASASAGVAANLREAIYSKPFLFPISINSARQDW